MTKLDYNWWQKLTQVYFSGANGKSSFNKVLKKLEKKEKRYKIMNKHIKNRKIVDDKGTVQFHQNSVTPWYILERSPSSLNRREYSRNFRGLPTHGFAHAKVYKTIFNRKILEFVGDIDIILNVFQSWFYSTIKIWVNLSRYKISIVHTWAS